MTFYLYVFAIAFIVLIINSSFRALTLIKYKSQYSHINVGVPVLFSLHIGNTRIGLGPLPLSIQCQPSSGYDFNRIGKSIIFSELVGLISYILVAIFTLGLMRAIDYEWSLLQGFFLLFTGDNRIMILGKLNHYELAGFLSLLFFSFELIPYKTLSAGKIIGVILINYFKKPKWFDYLQFIVIGLIVVLLGVIFIKPLVQ